MNFFLRLFKSKKAIFEENRCIISNNRHKIIIENRHLLSKKIENNPLIKTKELIKLTLKDLKRRRRKVNDQWNVTYHNFSWWNKLKYPDKLDLSEMDKSILKLKKIEKDFDKNHSNDIEDLNAYYRKAIERSEVRIDNEYKKILVILEEVKLDLVDDVNLFHKAFWFSSFLIPISFWEDFSNAANVYDSLRKVNGNFQDMSDSEIWWESLWMSEKSLSGLISLTKGAYFEDLVADDTGGVLFEHFNNPDTDIAINGTLYQLKSTDSISYIATVDEDIPIIATTEVAEKTEAIDGGYSNEELTNTVELALGGAVVDVDDTVLDAVLMGAGSLGLFATIRGINHAQQKFDSGMDGVEAIFEGAGVAIEGTAKGVVDASEMAYKVVMSRPSRFVGRLGLRVLKKIDEKL